MSKFNSWHSRASGWQKVILLTLSVILFFTVLELGLRLGGMIILSLQERRNQASLREKDTYRIMCLGESTTMDQYPAFLEEILNQHDLGIRFSVIDKGVSAILTSDIIANLEYNLDKYKPDMVIAMVGINDSALYSPRQMVSDSKLLKFIKSLRIYKLAKIIRLSLKNRLKDSRSYTSRDGSRPAGESLRPRNDDDLMFLAEEAAEEGVELNPKSDTGYVELGRFYWGRYWDFPRAEEAFKKALRLNPDNDMAYAELGWLYRDCGRFSEAEKFFSKALRLNPDNDHVYIGKGLIYQSQNRLSEAEEAFKKVLQIDPGNHEAYLGLGLIYQSQNRLSKAEEALEKAAALNPNSYMISYELGWLYRDLGKLSKAEEAFRRALELEPDYDRVFKALSLFCEQVDKPALIEECDRDNLRMKYYSPITVDSYRKLKEILDRRNIRLVCVQYPMRSVEPLKKIFQGDTEGIIFVDNEEVFKDAVKDTAHSEYFIDMFGGDFGHCTPRGNRLLAENIARVILSEVFDR